MAGLRRIAKMYGGLVAKDAKKEVVHKWDYEKDEPYIESERDRTDVKDSDKPKPSGLK